MTGAPLWTFGGPPRRLDVVGLGQCSLDSVAVVDGMPAPAGKRRILQSMQLPGGQIATALLACVRLGLRAGLVSSVGGDAAGQRVLEPLRAAGVELDGVRVVQGAPSQSAVVLIDQESGERTVLWHRDPRLSLKVSELRRAEIANGRVLHLDAGDLDVSLWAARTARDEGIPVVLDADTPAPGVESLLGCVDFPIVSREFAEEHFGTRSAAEALRGFAAMGARFAVVTLGDRGAVGGSGASVIESPAFRVEVKDTTGAGDVFHAAFVWGLLEGLDGAEILRAANAAAALNCRALGAQGGLPSRQELLGFLRERVPDGESRPTRP